MANVVSFRGKTAEAIKAVQDAGMSWQFFPLFVEATIEKGASPEETARAWGVPLWVFEMVAERLAAGKPVGGSAPAMRSGRPRGRFRHGA